jgi:hypothetical protein
MPRKQRPLERDGTLVRDASLIVIASEDRYAVEHYFGKFHSKRFRFRVLPTDDCRSSPEAVLDRLDDYRQEFDVGEHDELWACIDLDHWGEPNHIRNLRQVKRMTDQKGYRLAISHPCFDFWILLHFQDPPASSIGGCAEVAATLRGILPGYSKTSIKDLSLTTEQVEQAIDRATRLPPVESLTPDGPTTQVHLILESLRAKETIQLKASGAADSSPARE